MGAEGGKAASDHWSAMGAEGGQTASQHWSAMGGRLLLIEHGQRAKGGA